MSVSMGSGSSAPQQGDSTSSAADDGSSQVAGGATAAPAAAPGAIGEARGTKRKFTEVDTIDSMSTSKVAHDMASQSDDAQAASQKLITGKTNAQTAADKNKVLNDSTAELNALSQSFAQDLADVINAIKQTGDTSYIESDAFQAQIEDYAGKVNTITQKTSDNLSMGLPALTPPSGGGTSVDLKMTGGTSVNVFLGGNALVAFLMAFQVMFEMLKDIQKAEGTAKINALVLTMETAKDAGQAAYDANAAEAHKDFAQAAAAAVGVLGAAASLGATGAAFSAARSTFKSQVNSIEDSMAGDKAILNGNKLAENPSFNASRVGAKDFDPATEGQYMKADPEDPTMPAMGPSKDLTKPPQPQKTMSQREAMQEEDPDLNPLPGSPEEKMANERKIEAAKRIDANQARLTEMNGSKGSHIMQNMRSYTDQITMANQILQQGSQAVGSLLAGIFSLEKGKAEQQQQLLQGFQKLIGVNLDSASSSFKEAGDLFAQLVQTFMKMSDEGSKAFGYTTH